VIILQTSGEMVVLGEVVGRLVPRCTDPTIRVREEAILATQAALRIQLVHTGQSVKIHREHHTKISGCHISIQVMLINFYIIIY